MVSQEKPVFLRTFLVVLLILGIEFASFMFFMLPSGISGFSVINLSGVYANLTPSSKIFLVLQWAILAVLLIFVYFKNIGIHKRNREATGIHVQSAINRSKTNLDALYLVLKEGKRLSIKTISTLFKIKPELAIEWARILESGELVTIDYPSFGSPVVILNEEKPEEDKKAGEGKTPTTDGKDPEKQVKPKGSTFDTPEDKPEEPKVDEGIKKAEIVERKKIPSPTLAKLKAASSDTMNTSSMSVEQQGLEKTAPMSSTLQEVKEDEREKRKKMPKKKRKKTKK